MFKGAIRKSAATALVGALGVWGAPCVLAQTGQPSGTPPASSPPASPPPAAPAEAPAIEPPEPAPHRGIELGPTEGQVVKGITFDLTGRGMLTFRADLDNAEGDVSVYRLGSELGAAFGVGETGQIRLSFEYLYSHYDFEGATGVIAGTDDPWESVNETNFNALWIQRLSEQWTLLVGGILGAARESGADLGESIIGGGLVSVRYSFSKTFSAGWGVAVKTRLERDPLVLPILSLDWQFAERWRLSTGDAGPGVTVSYAATEQWTLALSGGWRAGEFRLDDDGPLPGGAVADSDTIVEFSAAYRPNKRINVGLAGGISFGEEFRIYDDRSNKINEVDVDPTGFVRIAVTIGF